MMSLPRNGDYHMIGPSSGLSHTGPQGCRGECYVTRNRIGTRNSKQNLQFLSLAEAGKYRPT